MAEPMVEYHTTSRFAHDLSCLGFQVLLQLRYPRCQFFWSAKCIRTVTRRHRLFLRARPHSRYGLLSRHEGRACTWRFPTIRARLSFRPHLLRRAELVEGMITLHPKKSFFLCSRVVTAGSTRIPQSHRRRIQDPRSGCRYCRNIRQGVSEQVPHAPPV